MEAWIEETARLRVELADFRGARDAAAPGSDLHELNQHWADRVGYRLMAYRLVEPVLAELVREFETARANEDQYRAEAWDDVVLLGKLAGTTGLVGGLGLAVGLMTSAPWWVLAAAVVLLVVCGVALVGGVAAYRDAPDTAHSGQLAMRIEALRQACERCDSAERLAEVRQLLAPPSPPRPSRLPSRIL